jgi:hypothetical protein
MSLAAFGTSVHLQAVSHWDYLYRLFPRHLVHPSYVSKQETLMNDVACDIVLSDALSAAQDVTCMLRLD